MGLIRNWLDLPPRERWLLCKAAVLLAAVRGALWVFPYSFTRQFVTRASRRSARLADRPIDVRRIAWAIDTASRRVPRTAHCLTQALAAQILLTRRGYPAKIHFGVLRESKAELMAHAWVEVEGTVVIGGADVDQRYIKLDP
jgi:hypothetical protein